MHITLKFLGEVSAHREESVAESLGRAAAGVSPFILHVGGFGAFPDPRRAKVIWVGCDTSTQIAQLHRHVEDNLSEVGFAKEKRSFHPHVTLGRVRREASPSRLTGLPGMFDRLDVEAEFPVKSIELMQSELSPAGAKYTVRASIGLTG
jgi:2'-5' RNA ligase